MELFIGLVLKEARQKKGLNLNQVADELKIDSKYLRALENEDFGSLPSPGYVLIYLNRYGEYLDLDTKELLKYYSVRGKLTGQEKLVPPQEDIVEFIRAERPFSKYLGVAAIVVILLVLGGIFLWPTRSPKRASPNRNHQEHLQLPIEEKRSETLQITATGYTWIRLIIDDKLVFEGWLYEGAEMQWEVEKKFTIRIGNVYKTQLKFAGQPVDILSSSEGGVVELSMNTNF